MKKSFPHLAGWLLCYRTQGIDQVSALSLSWHPSYGLLTYSAADSSERNTKIDLFDGRRLTLCRRRILIHAMCRPPGSEPLPKGIVAGTSNLEQQHLWGPITNNSEKKSRAEKSLLALAVGIKQKEVVDKIIRKFPPSNFVVMLFHYDGAVDEWMDLEWSTHAIHISAVNQTKWQIPTLGFLSQLMSSSILRVLLQMHDRCINLQSRWFAKRFLHPDIVFQYEYIFLWDEDLGVENFDPSGYLLIVKDEGLEISQPALDPVKSDVHHPITARSSRSRVHRRMYKFKGSGRCDRHSTTPPCVGWVEMMAPVFSKAAWRCVWHMIQNDLIHAWGLDQLLGYCAQGDRTRNVGVVDSEYIVHLGLPTLGHADHNQSDANSASQGGTASQSDPMVPSGSEMVDNRMEVRHRSFVEMQIFRKRWKVAIKEDRCWVDPYRTLTNRTAR
ncbi:hypothetical protein SAY87_018794 [Trapa incisa]|uniref:Uncharacterized protein n=1 Tax=Trapa incisa TaxID=236973 RepID=A0AAN7K4P7_9MYRT|nr:hypothetical protein SAY87_018794 [Trapa incisa]